MTTQQVTYQGPSSFAVRAAALIADAEGVELRSATPLDGASPAEGSVVLVLTVEASAEALSAALGAVRAELPAGATVG